MKNYMKKIIVGMFGFALLFVAQSVSASIWNGEPNDCKGISIVNATTNEGYAHPCWPASSISAEAGDTLNVRIYYHNTSTATANNVRVVLNAPTGSASSSKSFSGSISSDQGGLSLGNVTASLSTPQTITFNSVKWYTNNTSETLTSLPGGQSGSEILSGGLNLGSIAPGWGSQGSLVVSFHVSNTSTPVNNCSILDFKATPSTITSGQASTLAWSTTSDCTNVTISNLNYNVPTSGSQPVTPTQTTDYVLIARGSTGGDKTQTVRITVDQIPTPNYTCSIDGFTAIPDSISANGSSILTWNTTNCSTVTISNLGFNVPVDGIQQIWPKIVNASNPYTLLAIGANGVTQTRTVSVYVSDNSSGNNYKTCRIIDFDADDTNIEEGEDVRLSWTTENCDDIDIPGVKTNLSQNGSVRTTPSYSRTYVINASGDYGSDSDSVRITVDDNSYNYNYNNSYCSISKFTANDSYLTAGESVRLDWNTDNCTSVIISNIGSVYTSGSRTMFPPVSTNYVLTAYGQNGGIQTRSVFVTVASSYVEPIPAVIYNKCAVTTVATNVGQTSAQLNGIITGSVGADTYFEYGPTLNLGYRTGSRFVNGNTNFSESISSLSPNTIYFFRMVSNCQGGLSQGAIEIFRTQAVQTASTSTTKTVYVQQGTTVVGTASPVILTITNRYEAIGEGDLIDYTVTYKNIGKERLTRPMVQVVLPTNVTLVNASRGTYSIDTHTLSAQIEDLNSGQEGVIYLQGKVDSIPLNNSQIATTAILIYTGSNGSQENAMAYVINVPRAMMMNTVNTIVDNSVLGGAAFFGGLFSIGLIGWLLLILLILLIILIARSYKKNKVSTETVTHTMTH